MPLIRDEDEERRARVDQMIADLKQARDSAARQIEHAKQTIARSRNTMKRVDATLKRLQRDVRKRPL